MVPSGVMQHRCPVWRTLCDRSCSFWYPPGTQHVSCSWISLVCGLHYVVPPLQIPQPEIDLEGRSKPFILRVVLAGAMPEQPSSGILGVFWDLPPIPEQAATEAGSKKGQLWPEDGGGGGRLCSRESSWQPMQIENTRRSKFTAPLSCLRPQAARSPSCLKSVWGWGGPLGLFSLLSKQSFLAWLGNSASGPEDLLCWEVRWLGTLEDGVGEHFLALGEWGREQERWRRNSCWRTKGSPVWRSIWRNWGKGCFFGHKIARRTRSKFLFSPSSSVEQQPQVNKGVQIGGLNSVS